MFITHREERIKEFKQMVIYSSREAIFFFKNQSRRHSHEQEEQREAPLPHQLIPLRYSQQTL